MTWDELGEMAAKGVHLRKFLPCNCGVMTGEEGVILAQESAPLSFVVSNGRGCQNFSRADAEALRDALLELLPLPEWVEMPKELAGVADGMNHNLCKTGEVNHVYCEKCDPRLNPDPHRIKVGGPDGPDLPPGEPGNVLSLQGASPDWDTAITYPQGIGTQCMCCLQWGRPKEDTDGNLQCPHCGAWYGDGR